MTTRAAIDGFLAQRSLAVVGVSATRKKFGNAVCNDLSAKGYGVYPVNPKASEINGRKCYSNLRDLPEKVGGAVLVVPPSETEKVVQDAHRAGIGHIWMQQGAESPEAIRFCREQGMSVIHGECILMFAEPAGWIHRLHRRIRGMLGRLPA